MVESVTSTMNNNPITELPTYLDYSVTYSNGNSILKNHLLEAGSTETYKVKVMIKRDLNANQLPTSASSLNFQLSVQYKQADSNAVAGT